MNHNQIQYSGNTTASASCAGLRPPAGTVGSSGQSARPASGPRGAEGRQSTVDTGMQPTALPDARQWAPGALQGSAYDATGAQPSHNNDGPQHNPATQGVDTSQGGRPLAQIERQSSMNNLPRNRRPAHPKKVTRATLNIATLNIRGASGTNTANKWVRLNDTLKTERLGFIALQETHHLSTNKIDEINSKPGFRLHLLHSGDATAPHARGVGFALNKNFTRWQEASITQIIPGRALLLRIPWKNDAKLLILNVYAPNDEVENRDFWRTIRARWETLRLPKPNIMLGDFNITEEPIDREPAKVSNNDAVKALQELRNYFVLTDAWRNDNPYLEQFTWQQLPDRTTSSRLDRIYLTEPLRNHACEWNMTWSVVKTDHKMVSVKLYDPGSPFVGGGRWTIPLHLLHDRDVKTIINESGHTLLEALKKWETTNQPDPTAPQKLYAEWKKKTIDNIQRMAKTKIPAMDKRLKTLNANLEQIQQTATMTEQEKIANKAVLEQAIIDITEVRYSKHRDNRTVNGWVNRETIRKPWINENKEQKPRDTLTMLKIPDSNPPQYAKRTDEMLKIARSHHSNLHEETLPPTTELHTDWMREVVQNPETKLNDADKASLDKDVTTDEIREAIKSLPNGKSPGLDGIPHEFWKILMDRHDTYVKEEAKKRALHPPAIEDNNAEKDCPPPPVDVVAVLTRVTNNIARNGMREGSKFAEGWMCPIYKKKDRTEIANYRPITVLNADYKLVTRVLAMRLAHVAPNVVNKAQAGFMKGRHISDHTDLTQYMISRCELEEDNGAVVFLDQEKAYDKILHPYLWEVMSAMNFPETFINTIKTLYSDAYTTIIINGVLGEPFKITRGVRQGDPMSCLLFNLAIEPLSRMLRQTAALKGFQVQNYPEKLITTLFADDTTVYMNETDDFTTLQTILQKWCRASGGKFNVSKTEILPIGTPEYRKHLIETRQLGPNTTPIPTNIRIVKDGDHTRTLGAFVGNNINALTVWTPTLDGLENALTRWERGKPTQEGLRLTANIEIGGRTQYLTRVQGMPPEVLKRLSKRLGRYVWAGKQAMISKEILRTPLTAGGRRLLDIDARNEVLRVITIKSTLT